ncbi:hypothetical protein L1987_30338 [Smallanthus sonchifolius]|uniref:Uncharacterized protein n=1 Tax=Smallanthus sonchifolius TaxID=185202 RepID=A0ACB9I1X5_9ASTR|nr:hypothetical protein L1987_30338 [Smallanthus sonchifolius]
MMKAYFKFTEHTLWESIVKGPHIPKTTNDDGLVLIADPDLYSEENKKLIERDNRALGSIILALPTELYLNFEQHEIAQGLWNDLCLRFEGNAALQESRTDLLLKQYNMFSYKKNETLSEQVIRFTTMINRLRKMGVKFEENDLGKKLLDSLPDCWSIRFSSLGILHHMCQESRVLLPQTDTCLHAGDEFQTFARHPIHANDDVKTPKNDGDHVDRERAVVKR